MDEQRKTTGLEEQNLSAHNKSTVTLLIPMYNEEEALTLFYETVSATLKQLDQYSFEYLFVDDGSKDASVSIVKNLAVNDPRISYIALSRNFGKERAMLAGLDAVNTDAVIIMDADLQDPPSLIPQMLDYWQEGYQDVYAKRRSRAGESWLKKFTAKSYYHLLQKTTRIDILPDTGDFRLLDRACVEALSQFRESERNMKAMFSLIGFRKKAVYFDRDPRAAGKTKFNYWKLSNLAVDGITSFTTAPLRIAGIFGIAVSVAAFIYLIFIVIRGILHGSDVAGYPSTMAVVLFLGGVQLLSLGIIGEYIGRIFSETKRRPVYFIAESEKGAALGYSQDGEASRDDSASSNSI